MSLIGESATRSVAHRARGKRNQNKQLVRSANSLIVHRMLVAFRLSSPEQLIFLMQNRRNIMRTALPRRQWAGKQKYQMIGSKEISARWYLR